MARNAGWREPIAAVLRAVGVVLVVVGIALAYANRVVFDARAFAARSALALRDDRVATFVAERIADQAIARRPDIVAVRPVVVSAARTMVQSYAFGALFQGAAQRAHVLAFSKGTESVVLSLPDFAVLLNGAIAQLQPGVAERLPSSLGAQLGADVQNAMGTNLLRGLQAARRLRGFVLVTLLAGAICLAASVVVTRDRRRALLLAGLALAAAALVLFVLPGLLGVLATARIGDPALKLAARGVWVAFTARLETWAVALGGMGLVLAAAASSFAHRVEFDRALGRVWAWLRQAPARPAHELARAATILAAGTALALWPLRTTRLATVLAGATLVFEGVRSLFALIAPQLDEVASRAHEALDDARHGSRGHPGLRYALAALVVVAALGTGIAWFISSGAVPPLAAFVDRCNGAAELCDRPLDTVVFAGAHNAMSAADSPAWMFPNQEVGMGAQLRHGIRALLFDVHNGIPVSGRVKTVLADEAKMSATLEEALGKDGVEAAMRIRDRLVGPPEGPKRPYVCHGFCEIGSRPLDDVLREIRDFVVQHPGEVLLLVIEDHVPSADIAQAFTESGLLEFVYKGPAGPPWPTLRDLIAANERAVVMVENDRGNVPWIHEAYDVTEETPYHFGSPDEFSCRANRGGTGKSFFLMNHWIDTTPAPRPSNAAIVNQRDYLLDRVRRCEAERGKRPTLLAVDFALIGDVVGAAAVLNGIEAAPATGDER